MLIQSISAQMFCLFFPICHATVLESLFPGASAGSIGNWLSSCFQANRQSPVQLILSSQPIGDCLVRAMRHPDSDKPWGGSKVLPTRLSVHSSC